MKKIILSVLCAFLPAVAAAAVNVSTIGVVGQTVTVTTASAHGLAVNAGFCLSAPASVCSAAKTITNATTFTFDQPSNVTVAACASSCGTGDALPKVVVLDVPQSDQTTQVFHYLLWLTTLSPIPRAGAVSAWVPVNGSAGASAAQVSALAAGNVIERNITRAFPAGTTIAQVQAVLQSDYTTQQAAIAAGTQPGAFYGFVWNGSSWVQQ